MAANLATQRNWDVGRLASALGAEVRGVDLSRAGGDDCDAIYELLLENLVLFFPDQHLSVDDHIAFGRHFGLLEGHPNLKNPFSNHPEVFELAASQGGIADEWHSDISFSDSPSKMSILQMKQCPEAGGDTMWTSLYAAYDALSPPLQDMCEGLSALHDAHPHDHAEQTAIHPVVRFHPDTGRKALFVNEHFTRRIVEMSAQESDVFLKYLTNWASNPRFTVRYKWAPGTIAMWDNRCTQHFVLNDFEEERIIQRVTIMGDKVNGTQPRWEPRIDARGSALSRHDRQLSRHLKANHGDISALAKE